MFRGKALAALASTALVAAVVAGCSSSATPAPPKLSDPHQIITQSLTSTSGIKTVHIKVEVGGTIKLDGLQSAGASGLGLSSIKLDNTTIEGDADVNDASKPAVHMAASMPSFMGLSADFIIVDGYMYTKSSIGGAGDKYTKSKASTSSLPVPIPSASASSSQTVEQITAELKKQLDDAGIKPELKGVEKVAGQDAYHIALPVPLDKVNAAVAAAAKDNASMGLPSDLSLSSATIDLWSYVDGNRLAKVAVKGESSTLGNLTLTLTLSKYNEKVTIKAPPADQVASE